MTDVISLECHKLHELVDGELGGEEAERFRIHLASCERCAAEMPRLLELVAACEEYASVAAPRPVVPARSSRPRRAGYLAAAGAAVAAAVVALVLVRDRPVHLDAPVAFAGLSASRAVDVRLSYAGAAGYRPYVVSRGDVAHEDLSFELLAKLERAGDWHGLAVASLLRGDRAGAARHLEQAGRSGSTDTDRAALEILDGSDAALERALTLLDAVLATEPDNLVARWNRALALARLELPLAAARELDRVAAAGEPGWSAEAMQRARGLRATVELRRGTWDATSSAGKRWIAGDGPVVPPANASPGLLRGLFYDAVRAAGSRARVEALFPLASQLDAVHGGDVLTRYVRTVAAADFRTRAPLAAAFRDFALDPAAFDDDAKERLAARLHTPGTLDIWMGFLTRSYGIGRHLADYRTAAAATGDSWFAVLEEHEAARHEIAAGNRLDGERRLLAAAEHAARAGLEYRRLAIEVSISELYLALRRFPEAERRARKARMEAQAAGEWGLEDQLIYRLAEASRFRSAIALSRAYLAEALERSPGGCEASRYVHQSLANLAMMQLDPVTARREMVAAPLCGAPLQLQAAETWADLYRFGGTDADVRRIREGLAALRATGSLDAGQRAVVDHVEGRLVIELDRPAGQALLRKAIAASSGHTDDWSTKARAHSFSILALDAGRAGEFDRVLELLAEELGGAAPARCVAGVAVEDERAIVAVRGPDGSILGAYTGRRPSPHIDAASLIPATLVRRLEGCAEVSVLARPPLGGTARLLPDTFAWSYHLGGPAAPRLVAASGARLVVADTSPPADLELPRLLPYAGDTSGARVLRGSAATLASVRSEMRDAAVIEFHTHGFVDRGLSDASYLALTPDREGNYALTAADVQSSELRGAPLVILAACHAAVGAPFFDEGVGLPLAFARAGASAVLASPAVVNDANAGAFFEAVRARIVSGATPATAVRDERMRRIGNAASDWVSDVIVYQ